MIPKISFAGCVYNKAAWIAESIESLQKQTLENIEVLFVDDGSTDGTPDIIRHYMKDDKRIRLFRLKRNMGLGIAWAEAHKQARSDIIAVISGDDIWTQKRAELTYRAFQNKSIDVFYGSFYFCDHALNILEYKPAVPYSKKKLLTPRADGFSTQYIGHFVAAYKKDIAIKYPYDKSRKFGIDYPFFVQLAKNNCKFGWTNQVLGFARKLETSVSYKHREEIVRQDREMENREMKK